MIREKGTNRSQFFRGEADKYTWMDIGSSYLPSDLVAAFLWAQMEEADEITRRRLGLWETYHQWFASLENRGKLTRPVIPENCQHNAHMYYLLMPDLERRATLIETVRSQGIGVVFHYVPLHSSPFGKQYTRVNGPLPHTEKLSERLVRLPLWLGLEDKQVEVIERIIDAVG